MALRSLGGLAARTARERRGRAIITTTGIALGVAIFFGVADCNASIDRAYAQMADAMVGRADVIVSPLGTGITSMPTAVADRLRGAGGVADAAAFHVVWVNADRTLRGAAVRRAGIRPMPGRRLPTEAHMGVPFALIGTVPADASRLDASRLTAGRLPAPGAPEIAVAAELQRRLQVHVGERLDLTGAGGRQRVTVTGVLEDTGAARLAGGTAVGTLESAGVLSGAPSVVTSVEIRLRHGVQSDRWIEDHRALAGPSVDLVDAASFAAPIRASFRSTEQSFSGMSAVALFVGVFLIYLTLSMAVLERTRLYGMLFALGGTRGQVRRLVLGEAAVLAAVGTASGVVVGLGIGLVLLRVTARLIGLASPALVVPPAVLAVGIAAGFLMTLAASWIPARRAARVSPVEALRNDHEPPHRSVRSALVGGALIALGLAVPTPVTRPILSSTAITFVLFGLVLSVPLILSPVARLVGRTTRRLAAAVGEVAVMHLVKERSRSAFTLALVMIVMALAIMLGAAVQSARGALSHQIDAQFGADLRVFGTFDANRQAQVAKVAGVRAMTTLSFGSSSHLLADHPELRAYVEVIDPRTYFDVSGFAFVEGDGQRARTAMAGGGTVLLPGVIAQRLHSHPGDTIRLTTTAGVRRFEVGGTYVSFFTGPGIVVSATDGRLFGAGVPGQLELSVQPGERPVVVGQRIATALGRGAGERYQAASLLKQQALGRFDRFTAIFYSILGVAVLIGLLGLANTLAMSVLERTREIGLLRAVGVHRRSIGAMVRVESATLAAVALLLSVPLGAVLTTMVLRGVGASSGYRARFVFPWSSLPIVAALGVVVAVVAAAVPARRASRLDVIAALRTD